jgi:bacillithiol biosynthesis deacetylase BshB1
MQSVALIVAAHPDDAEIAMGGTIAALVSQGVRVIVADLTNGEPTPHGSPEIRAKETAMASGILGISERRLLSLTNREVFDTIENRKVVSSLIREVRPDILFGPYWEDAHPDHTEASRLIEAARFYSKFVKSDLPHAPWYPRKQFYYFSTHMKGRFSPSFVYDISPFLEKKIDSINAYASQFVTHLPNRKRIEEIRVEARYWGHQVGVDAGEPFVCRETVKVDTAANLFAL